MAKRVTGKARIAALELSLTKLNEAAFWLELGVDYDGPNDALPSLVYVGDESSVSLSEGLDLVLEALIETRDRELARVRGGGRS